MGKIPYIALSGNKNYLLISVDISRLNKQALRDLRDNTKSVNKIKKIVQLEVFLLSIIYQMDRIRPKSYLLIYK